MNKFVSESELNEKRQKRQEEWERVRKADDPKEAPDEPYDSRSLFEQLQEQKDKKQEEFEESIKFKNQFRGVSKDEVSFLDQVAKHAFEHEKKISEEVNKELQDYRKAVAEQTTNVKSSNTALSENKVAQQSSLKRKSLQSTLIGKAVKRKKSSTCTSQSEKDSTQSATESRESKTIQPSVVLFPSVRKCAGVLPGIGSYSDDSDSSSIVSFNSDSETS